MKTFYNILNVFRVVFIHCIHVTVPCVLQGLGTDEESLNEIVCSRNNEELMEIKKVYKESECL